MHYTFRLSAHWKREDEHRSRQRLAMHLRHLAKQVEHTPYSEGITLDVAGEGDDVTYKLDGPAETVDENEPLKRLEDKDV